MHKGLSDEYFRMHLSHLMSDDEIKQKGVTLANQGSDYAIIKLPINKIGKNICLKIENINFDLEPLHLYFVDPDNFDNLPSDLYPTGGGIATGHDFLPNPIICISSTYSYHTHPGHRNTPFDGFRNVFELSNLVKTILRHLDNDWAIPEGGLYRD